ncbi:MAG: hypothetical protein HC915_21490, partial [Anaerolineae bacterium]|nr:hypothetical protein [Anaerolineae bacterium]
AGQPRQRPGWQRHHAHAAAPRRTSPLLEPTGNNSYCLVCHQYGTDQAPTLTWDQVTLEVDPHDYTFLIHHSHSPETGVGCADCHPSDVFPHLELGQSAPQWAFAEDYALSCQGCHQNPANAIEGACSTCHAEDALTLEQDVAVLNVDPADCASCHAETVAAWEDSAHGDQQLACDSCHLEPHAGTLRIGDTQALCLNCHNQTRDQYVHVMHVEQSCADCHVDNEAGAPASLHVVTAGFVQGDNGHDFLVGVDTCVDCHVDGVEVAAAPEGATGEGRSVENHPLVLAQERIETLEAEIDAEREDAATTAAVRFIQSLIVGLAVGSIVAVGTLRYRRRLGKATETTADPTPEHGGHQ